MGTTLKITRNVKVITTVLYIEGGVVTLRFDLYESGELKDTCVKTLATTDVVENSYLLTIEHDLP